MELLTDKRRRIGWLVLLALGGVLHASEALGHKVNVFAAVEGKTIRGEVYFRGGAPAQDAKVELLDPDGGKLGEVITDPEGKFSFPVRFRCDHRLLANVGEGHAGEYTVEAGDLPDDLPPRPGGAGKPGERPPPSVLSAVPSNPPATLPGDAQLKEMIEAAVSRQLTPLRRQLDRFESAVRIRDVLGGIGYICGISGLLFYFLGARRRGPGAK